MGFPDVELKDACKRSHWAKYRSWDHLLEELKRNFKSRYLLEHEDDIKRQLGCSEEESRCYSFAQHFAKYSRRSRNSPDSPDSASTSSAEGQSTTSVSSSDDSSPRRHNSYNTLAEVGSWHRNQLLSGQHAPPITETLGLEIAPDAFTQRQIHDRRKVS